MKKIIIILVIFFLDRLSKIYILNLEISGVTIDFYINPFLNFYLVWNSGIGFGLLSFDQSVMYNVMTILIIFVNLLIVYLIIKSKDKTAYFFLIILGGSLGNLFDRIYYSAVPDFIDISYKGYHWFVFNVADIFITVGIMCLILVELFFNKHELND